MSVKTVVQDSKPVLRKDISKFAWTLKEMRKNGAAYLMIAPFFILFFVFTVVPVLLSIVISFTTFNMLEFPKWIFMDNYIRLLLDDEIFLIAIKNTIVFAILTGPLSYLLSLFFAWFINELRPKIRAFVTLIFYAPSIAGNVYLIWIILFSGDQYGLVNGLLMDLNIINSPILFFQDTRFIMPLIIAVALWSSLGTSFLTFIAGFQVVDKSLYEAGAVDGIKNRWQELWFITLPTMRPQMMLGAILAITGSFGFGGIITALVGFPSPDYVAHTIMHHLEDYGGMRFELGYSSAIATILFFMMLGANLLVTRLLRKVGT
ncbi:MAG: ABC transporter permease [Clostridiales bacterium GWF2_38_85]|nr:MAG: ABC transporter permease [Clostridiales bacterium GWF2_38_85]HBL83613.1 ABC transporter permease [Clostridiales bacterium]